MFRKSISTAKPAALALYGARPAAVQARYGGAARDFNIRILLFLSFFVVVSAFSTQGRADSPVIVAFGDSLTAGYGLANADSFPEQLADALKAAGRAAKVINAGVSGDTTAGGASRIDWALADQPDLVIVELGANDGLRGFEPAKTRENLDFILARSLASGAQVLFTGMMAPRNLGKDYVEEFDGLFPALADKYPDAVYYPFFLDGVAANPALNLGDGIHPNADGVAVIVERILPFVLKALNQGAAG